MDTSELVDGFLAHHGIKGMKWGVRRDKGHEGEAAKTKKIAKLDKAFARKTSVYVNAQTGVVFPSKLMIQVHNRAADLTNEHDVNRINNKPQYKNADFTKPSTLRTKYYAEHQAAYTKNLEKAAKELGTNASGTKEYSISMSDDGSWLVITKDVKHDSGSDSAPIIVKVSYNAKGFITKLTPTPSDLSHDEIIDTFLSHHGVKGMHWGVKRGRLSGAVSSGKKSSSKKKENESEDSAKASAALHKSKSQGTHTLSNKELQDLVTRMNLEQQYSRLTASQAKKTKSEGAIFAKEILKTIGKKQLSTIGNEIISDKVTKPLIKSALASGGGKHKK